MKKITIFYIFLFHVLLVQSNNILKIGQYTVQPTTEFSIQLEAENSDSFVAFQLDIPIPEGFIYIDGSAHLNASRISGHALNASLLVGNVLRLIGYSLNNTAFLGNVGTLVSFNLKSGSVPAAFPLLLNQATIGNSQSNNILNSTSNGDVTVLAPDIKVSTTGLDFGRVALESFAEQGFQITNEGSSDLNITSLVFNDSQFTTTQINNFVLTAGSSQWISVKFTPTAKATLAKQLQIKSNDPDQAVINLNLNAVAYAVNEIHVGSIVAASGSSGKLDISINNMEAFTGFQFDLNLPSLMSYTVGTAQLFRSDDHVVSVNQLNANTLRVITFSPGNKNFTGKNGKAVSLYFLLNGVAGYYNIGVSNIILANSNSENVLSASYAGSVQISSPYISTPNQLNFGDVSITSEGNQNLQIYNYGQEPLIISQLKFSNEYFKSPQVLPLTIPVNAYFDLPVKFKKTLKGSSSGTLKIVSNDVGNNPLTIQLSGNAFVPNYILIKPQNINLGGTKNTEVEIENEEEFVAFQFDLNYPIGLTPNLNAIALTDRKQDHLVMATSLPNNTIRILVYSPNQKTFTGKLGSVLYVPFTCESSIFSGNYNLVFSNAFLSNIKSENILYSSTNGVISIGLFNSTIKINEENFEICPNPATNNFSIDGIEECATLKLIDMNGREILSKQILDKEKIMISSLPKGLYIVKIISENGVVERKMLKN
ncbi:MAG: choice-of-anchor D domain-containing protein [Paludibacter sp.]|nr:choice-of-anchor D domain-containing protein [Paludibacter sp.]